MDSVRKFFFSDFHLSTGKEEHQQVYEAPRLYQNILSGPYDKLMLSHSA